MAKLLDGKDLSEKMNLELKNEIEEWVKTHERPRLVCILVGDDPASAKYVEKKREASKLVGKSILTHEIFIIQNSNCSLITGIQCDLKKFDSSITELQILKEIENLNKDKSVNGILVQLPVPESMSERTICNAISQYKDVDGFHISNVGELCLDMANAIIPCTPYGVMEIIKRYNL